jgi:hypothetical protein
MESEAKKSDNVIPASVLAERRRLWIIGDAALAEAEDNPEFARKMRAVLRQANLSQSDREAVADLLEEDD